MVIISLPREVWYICVLGYEGIISLPREVWYICVLCYDGIISLLREFGIYVLLGYGIYVLLGHGIYVLLGYGMYVLLGYGIYVLLGYGYRISLVSSMIRFWNCSDGVGFFVFILLTKFKVYWILLSSSNVDKVSDMMKMFILK